MAKKATKKTKRQIKAAAKKAEAKKAEAKKTVAKKAEKAEVKPAADPKRSKSGLVSTSNLGSPPVQTRKKELIQVSDLDL